MRGGYLDICRSISSTPSNDAATPRDRAYPCSPAAACPMHGRAAVGVSEATRHARPELHTCRPALLLPRVRSNLVDTTRTSRYHFTPSLSRPLLASGWDASRHPTLCPYSRSVNARCGRARSNPARLAGTSHLSRPSPLLPPVNSNLVGTTRTSRPHFTPSLSRPLLTASSRYRRTGGGGTHPAPHVVFIISRY